MKDQEILDYISKSVSEKMGKLTRITLKNGQIYIGHFLKEAQSENLVSQNKWILIQGGSKVQININGEVIKSIKEN